MRGGACPVRLADVGAYRKGDRWGQLPCCTVPDQRPRRSRRRGAPNSAASRQAVCLEACSSPRPLLVLSASGVVRNTVTDGASDELLAGQGLASFLGFGLVLAEHVVHRVGDAFGLHAATAELDALVDVALHDLDVRGDNDREGLVLTLDEVLV